METKGTNYLQAIGKTQLDLHMINKIKTTEIYLYVPHTI